MVRKIYKCFLVLTVFLSTSLGAHELDTGKAMLSVNDEGLVLLEVNVGLSDFIRDTTGLKDNALPMLVEFEESGSLPWQALRKWEELFGLCEVEFTNELLLYEDGEVLENVKIYFPSPTDLSLNEVRVMKEKGLHITVNVSALLSESATNVQVKFPEVLGEVILTKYNPDVEWVVTGERSEPLMLEGDFSTLASSGHNGFWKFLTVGFEHILPKGLDHILFVIGLFLLAARVKPLLLQVTAFTLAHTLTLGLSVYGLVSLPSSIVEPLIALSIAAIAIENVFTDRIHKSRPIVVFVFGLLHGLGFAGILNEVGLPEGDILMALFGFNVGVEIGQLTVITLCLLSLGWFRNRVWYRRNLTIPLSILIGVVGLYWTYSRILGN